MKSLELKGVEKRYAPERFVHTEDFAFIASVNHTKLSSIGDPNVDEE